MEDKKESSCRTELSALSDKLMVAAIDFGTTYSSWAYLFRHEFKTDPSKVCVKNWINGSNISSKAPTTVLIKPDGETFEAFGYQAEDKYAELCADGKHKDWYYFTRFKMMLHDNTNIEENILLEDATSKCLPAKDVFKHAIKFLREDLKSACSRSTGESINDSDILWVLTVPAIWNDMAKRFMRQASEEAGILGSNLKIALEPECASLYCMMLDLGDKKDADEGMFSFRLGAKYMVVDAGGGTVDISVHEVLEDGFVKELCKASGGAWGGTEVDKTYKQILMNIFGKTVLDKFENENMDDYIDFFRNFEVKKRTISNNSNTDTIFRMPATLIEIYTDHTGNTLQQAVASSYYCKSLVYEKGNKIRIKASLMRSLFTESIECILEHISKLLYKKIVSGVEAILMVGGLSECQLLQDSIKNSFGHLKVIVPREGSLSVLKGAVMFGYRPTVVVERILQYTYGIKMRHPFVDGVHPCSNLLILDGRKYCEGCFSKVVESEQAVKLTGQTEIDLQLRPSASRGMTIELYGSKASSPLYVTDRNCFKIGSFEIIFDEDVPGNLQKLFRLSGFFGETEIILAVEDPETKRTYIGKYALPKF